MIDFSTNDINKESMQVLIEEHQEEIEGHLAFIEFSNHVLKDDVYWKRWEERHK